MNWTTCTRTWLHHLHDKCLTKRDTWENMRLDVAALPKLIRLKWITVKAIWANTHLKRSNRTVYRVTSRFDHWFKIETKHKNTDMKVDGGWTPLHARSISLSFIFRGCGLSFSLPLFFCHALWACGIPSFGYAFFLTCFVSMWHTFFGYASFIYFCIAHILDGHFREKESWYAWSFILWVDGNVLLSSSVEE